MLKTYVLLAIAMGLQPRKRTIVTHRRPVAIYTMYQSNTTYSMSGETLSIFVMRVCLIQRSSSGTCNNNNKKKLFRKPHEKLWNVWVWKDSSNPDRIQNSLPTILWLRIFSAYLQTQQKRIAVPLNGALCQLVFTWEVKMRLSHFQHYK